MSSVSVLETQRSLVLVEKGSGDTEDVELITAAPAFRLVATMNPGGDFGKKEVTQMVTSSPFLAPFLVFYSRIFQASQNILDFVSY